MARRIDYVIAVDDSQATAKVAAFEQRATSAGSSTGGLATATRDLASAQSTLDKQTQSMVGTVTKYGSSIATAAEKSVDLAMGLDAQSRAVQATDKLLADLETRYPSVASSTVAMETATVAATGAVEGLSGAVFALMAGLEAWLVPAIIVGEAINLIANYFADASLAAETLAAKQDVINKAYGMSGVLMSYGDAVKYVNQQLERTNPLADNAGKALISMNLAMAAGPTNAGMESMRLLAKAGDDVSKVLQQDLERLGGQDGLTKAMDLLRAGTATDTAQFNEWAKSIGLSSTTLAVLHEQVKVEKDDQDKATAAAKQATAEYERQQKALQRLVDTADQQRGELSAFFFGADELEKAERTVDVVSQIADSMDVLTMSAERQKAAKTLIDQAFDDYVRRGKEVPPGLLQIAAALEAIVVPAAKLGSLGGFSGIGPLLSNPLTLSNGASLPAFMPNIDASPGQKFGVTFAQSMEKGILTEMQRLPQLLESAVLHGGGWSKFGEAAGVAFGNIFGQSAAKSIAGAPKITDSFTKSLGRDLMSFGISSLIDVGIGLLSHIGAPSQQELQGRSTEGSFEQSMASSLTAAQRAAAGPSQLTQGVTGLAHQYVAGGMDEITAYKQANEDFARVLSAEQAGGTAVQSVIDGINARLDRMHAAQKDVQDGVDSVVTHWNAAGKIIPQDMQDAIAHLLTLNGLTDDQKSKLQGLLDSTKPSFDDLSGAAQHLGLDISKLGPALAQQDIDHKAKDIFDNFTLLQNAGADFNSLLGGTAGKFNDIVQESVTTGTKVPANLRPILEVMGNNGLLKYTDKAGKEFHDLSGISFEDTPIDKSLTDLQSAIDHLADVLEHKLPDAIKGLPDHTVTITTRYDTQGQPADPLVRNGVHAGKFGWNYDGTPDWDGDPTNSMKFGGYGYAAGPMTFTTQGNEYYAFSGEGKRFGSSFTGASQASDPALLDEVRALRDEMAQVKEAVRARQTIRIGRQPLMTVVSQGITADDAGIRGQIGKVAGKTTK